MTNPKPFNWTAELEAADALAEIVADFVAPLWPGANMIRATDGRFYVHEFDRWGSDPIVTERRGDLLLRQQDYPKPPQDFHPQAAVVGTIWG